METVIIQWDTVSGAESYNVYRSTDSLDIGTKINVSPVLPSGGAVESYADSAASGMVYFYRVTTLISGMESLPSSALRVSVGSPQDITPRQATIIGIETRG